MSPLTASLAFGGFSATGIALGSVGTPSISFTGDTNTGLYSSGADAVDITAGGVNALRCVNTAGVILVTSTSTATTQQAELINTNAGTPGVTYDFYHNSASPADDDNTTLFQFYANDDGATKRIIGQMYTRFLDVTSTTMDSSFNFVVMNAVNAGNAATTATLSSTGVWTDAACDLDHKVYEGTPEELWGDPIEKIKQLRVSRFHSKFAPEEKHCYERHCGPTMDQLHDLFGIGTLDHKTKKLTGLAAIDVAGVALIGVQSLITRIEALERKK